MADNVIPMPDKGETSCAEVKAAQDYGYMVHLGDAQSRELQGRWWWTLSKPGWMDCVTDPSDHDTEREAWISAIAHHKAELMLDQREEGEPT